MVEADFLVPLAEFEKGKLAEGRELKHKYYDATLAFDAQKDKVASLMKNQEKNAAKLPVAEAELDNLARARDQIGREVAASLRAIEADKKEQLYEKMNAFLVAQYGYHQNVFELLRESESFMEGLAHRARGGTAASLASAKAAVVGKASAVMAGGMAALGLGAGAAAAVAASPTSSSNAPTPFDDEVAVDPSNPFAASPAKPAAVSAGTPAASEANPFDDPPTGRGSVGRKSLPAPPPKAAASTSAADQSNPFAPAAVVGAGAAGVALAGAGIAGAMTAAKSATPESTLAQASSAAESAKAKAAEASALASEKTAEAQRIALEKQKQAMELAQEKAKEQMKGNPFGQMAVGMVGAKAANQMESATNSAADKVKGNIDSKNQAIASTSDKVSANSEKLAGMAAQVPK